jgi:hypothetical protein
LPDRRLLTWQPVPLPVGLRVRQVEAEHAVAIWGLIEARRAAAQKGPPVFPVFVFERLHEAEIENPDLSLAGQLWFGRDKHKRGSPSEAQKREIAEIVRGLTDQAAAGQMPFDALCIGWQGDGQRPSNAVDVYDENVMREWKRYALEAPVRIARGSSERFTFDRDLLRQLGAPPTGH